MKHIPQHCRHCGMVIEPGELCERCLHPEEYRPRPEPRQPSNLQPGSREKIRLMQQRWHKGESVTHPNDRHIEHAASRDLADPGLRQLTDTKVVPHRGTSNRRKG